MVNNTIANLKKVTLNIVIKLVELLIEESPWNCIADDFLTSGAFKNALTTPVSSVALPININTIAKPYKNTIMFCLLDLYHKKNLCASNPNDM